MALQLLISGADGHDTLRIYLIIFSSHTDTEPLSLIIIILASLLVSSRSSYLLPRGSYHHFLPDQSRHYTIVTPTNILWMQLTSSDLSWAPLMC